MELIRDLKGDARRLSIPDLEGFNVKRRLSIPELKGLKEASGSKRKDDCNDLPEGKDLSLPKGGPVLSRSLRNMDRAITPDHEFDPNQDRAFTNLRPVTPQYIPVHQRLNSLGDSQESSEEDSDTEKPTKRPVMSKTSEPSHKEQQQYQVMRPKSRSRRHLVKIPIESKKAKKGTPKYPTSMLNYDRGVSPTPPQMQLRPSDEPSLSSLRSKTKLKISNNFRKNLEIIQLRFASMEMQEEFEQMEKEIPAGSDKEVDLLHMMGDDGKIIWNNIDNTDMESILDSEIDSMPTMDQNIFQDMDPEEIFDAYLTDKYIVLETNPSY